MNVLERARAKREAYKVNQAGRTKTYKFKPGKTLISLLPLHDEVDKPASERNYYREYGMHFIKNRKDEFVVSVGDRSLTYGEDCPVRDGLVDMIRYANSIGDDELAEQAKKSLAKKNVLIGVFVHKNTEGKEEGAQLISISESLHDQFLAVIEEYAAEDLDAPLRWEDRLCFIVEREGTGATDTRYKVLPAAKRMTVEPSVMTSAVGLDEYIKGQFDEAEKKALSYISSITGKSIEGSGAAAALTGGASRPAIAAPKEVTATVVDDDDDLLAAAPPRTSAPPAMAAARAEDAEFEDVMAPATKPELSADDLMAEIDRMAA